MKTKNKALLLMLCAVLLVAASVLGTMAYLTSTDSVENTFTVGKVALKLDEAKVNPDGSYVTDHDNRVKANDYHLLPGHTYIKDPTVTVVKGSDTSYVRMLVTINKQEALNAIFKSEGGLALDKFFGGSNEKWELKSETVSGDSRVYEFRYATTVAAPDNDVVLPDLFQTITVPGTVTGEQLATIKGLEIDVVAEAIQADGFANADAAWAAFSAE